MGDSSIDQSKLGDLDSESCRLWLLRSLPFPNPDGFLLVKLWIQFGGSKMASNIV